MDPLHLVRERAAHDEPHDDLGALEAAEPRVLGVGHRGEAGRVVGDRVEELVVPLRVVEARALAVHLVGEAAGGDDGHVDVLGVALDRAAQRLAQLVAAGGGRDRELEHADLQRDDLRRPLAVRPVEQHGHGREEPVVKRLALEVGQVELVGDQAGGDVRGELRVALDRGQVAGAAALVGDRVLLADAEGEGRVVVEEERRDVVVEDVDDRVGLLLAEPVLDRLERLEDRRPGRVVLLVLVVGEANGRRVRCRNAADDPGHVRLQGNARAFRQCRHGL